MIRTLSHLTRMPGILTPRCQMFDITSALCGNARVISVYGCVANAGRASVQLDQTRSLSQVLGKRTLTFLTNGSDLCQPRISNCIDWSRTFSLSSQLLIDAEKVSSVSESNKQGVNQGANEEKSDGKSSAEGGEKSADGKKPTLYQRFKQTYKQYGKVLIAFHAVASFTFIGIFYCLVSWGVDVVGLMERIGVSEIIISPFKKTGLGTLAVAYLMYKVISPLRYIITIVGTQFIVKILRQRGYMKPVAESEKVRELLKEGIRETREEIKARIRERAKFSTLRKRIIKPPPANQNQIKKE